MHIRPERPETNQLVAAAPASPPLAGAEERTRVFLESAPDAAVIVGSDGEMLLVNGQTEALFGYDREELVGRPIEMLLPERLRHAHVGHRRGYLSDPRTRPMGAGLELAGRRKDGSEFPVDISLSAIETDEGRVAMAFIRDVTQRKVAEEKLAYQAMHDSLTDLPNRSLLKDRLDQALARSRRTGRTIAVLFLDLDHFKVINDGRGHAVGDQLLVAVAHRLRSVVRPGDTVARFGGDEFVVVFDNLGNPWEASQLSERLMGVVEAPMEIDGTELFVTASVGVAVAGPGASAGSLLRDADTAMYRAKETGRGRVELFDEVLRQRADRRLEIAAALRHAIQRRGFSLAYQPVVSLADGRIVGAEALLRWEHPEWGSLAPARFITVAEETGLIVPIGAWVLEEACRQAVRWQAESPTAAPRWVSVNLSARQLVEPSLVETVGQTVARTGIEPDLLHLEVTESVVMDDVELFLERLLGLRSLGIHLSVDDFGTGYSSLSYLKRFPIDTLKVDRSFVDGLTTPGNDASIVAAVVALARALGLTVLAEGVETPEQLHEVRHLGCDLAQGFFVTRPLPGSGLAALLHRWDDAAASALLAGQAGGRGAGHEVALAAGRSLVPPGR